MKTHTLYLAVNRNSTKNVIRFDVKSDLTTNDVAMVLRPHYKWEIFHVGNRRWWETIDITYDKHVTANSLDAAIHMLHTLDELNMYTTKTETYTYTDYVALQLNSWFTVTKVKRYGYAPGFLFTIKPEVMSQISQCFTKEEGIRKVIRAMLAAKLDEECGTHIKLWNYNSTDAYGYTIPSMEHYILLSELPAHIELEIFKGKLCLKKQVIKTKTVTVLAEPTCAFYVDLEKSAICANSKYYTPTR